MPYKNPEKARESARQRSAKWRAKNLEAVSARAKAYYQETAEHQKSASKDWYENNKEASAAKAKRWREDNPEKVLEYRRARRAKLAEVPSEPYTTQEILDIYGIVCHLCNLEIDLSAPRSQKAGVGSGWELGLQLDHVTPLSLGGSDLIVNIRPSHGICNIRKSNRMEAVSE